MKLEQKREQLFYVIKLIRLTRCLGVFNINIVMKKLKKYVKDTYEYNLFYDPMLAYNVDLDQNKIEDCLLTEFFLKILRLVVTILAISYFFGIIFLVVAEAVLDY